MHLLEKAIILAVEAHAGQVQRDGTPYVLHPLYLMTQMETIEEKIVAVLHDVVEDTAISLIDLHAVGFSDAVVEAIRLLSRQPEMSYAAFIEEIRPNPLARRVKLADLAHNMDVRRLPQMTQDDTERLVKYRQAWDRLV